MPKVTMLYLSVFTLFLSTLLLRIDISNAYPSKSNDCSKDESCEDNDAFRYENKEEQSCRWIGANSVRRKLCSIPEVSDNCRLSCYVCCYEAGISSTSKFCTFAGVASGSQDCNGEDNDLFCPPDEPPFRHPTFTEEVLTKEVPGKGLDPNYGVLKALNGTWVNFKTNGNINYGLHTTSMPSPGTNPEVIPGKFHFLSENYVEELTFTALPVAARNRAGANEQFVGAIKYEQVINNEQGKGLHDEVGMYMWLKDMYNHPASEESIKTDLGKPEIYPGFGINDTFAPSYSIARSGTIPHGSTIQLLGNYQEKKEGKPVWPEGNATWEMSDSDGHLAITRSMGGRQHPNINLDEPAPHWVHDPTLPIRDASGNRAYTQRILAHPLYPYSARPDLRLRDTVKDLNVTEYTFMELSSIHQDGQGAQGGVLNTPLIQRSTPVSKVTVRLWLEKVFVEDGHGGGKHIDQLQYEQVMFFVFQFGTDGGSTIWPHIQVNTLRRKEDVMEDVDSCDAKVKVD